MPAGIRGLLLCADTETAGFFRMARYRMQMRIAVVGSEDGKPYIRWGPAIFSTVVLAIFASGGAFGMYYLLTGTMSSLAALVGLAGAITAVTSGIRRAMKDPVPHNRT